jgi:hypothetical protein
MSDSSTPPPQFVRLLHQPTLDPSDDLCDHPVVEWRWRTMSNGVIHLVLQCLDCGRQQRSVTKAAATTERDEADTNPPFDDALTTRYYDARHERRERNADERRADWWRSYNAYLASDAWRERRAAVFDRDGGVCQARLTGCTTTALHVHHLTYDHLGAEPLFDLTSCCRACHDQITAMDRTRRGQR